MLKPLVVKLLGKWAGFVYALAGAFLLAYPELREAIPSLPAIGDEARLILGTLGVVGAAASQGVKPAPAPEVQ
jgi:hypothetical protein